MTPDIITITILILIIALAAVAASLIRRRKADPPAASPAPARAPAPAPTGRILRAGDYADSFFSGFLDGVPTYAYKLPTGVKGYGPNGTYDKNAYDPRAFDAARERIMGKGGNYVDVATLTHHYPDGSTDTVDRKTMRQWLYGLSIDPACVNKNDLLAMGIVTAPRAYLRADAYTGPGAFGG